MGYYRPKPTRIVNGEKKHQEKNLGTQTNLAVMLETANIFDKRSR